ncbi:MAG: fused MFS/spermidine synthase [Candidatus Omnitrophota bacterium]|nr:fused MFS/spermidine synthase [Candidatus Omnitrophota bacterium]
MKKGILFSIALIGFTAIVAQIIFMREFLVVFYGNEIAIGIIFTSWFAAGMLGSWLLGRFTDKINSKLAIFSLCQLGLSILLPLSILAIRSTKSILHLGSGEVIPVLPMFLSAFIILLPVCLLLGFMFSLSSSIDNNNSRIIAVKIGMVYFLETAGSIIGGLLVSFVLIRLLNPFQIMAVLSLLNITGALFLQTFSESKRIKLVFIAIFTVSFIAVLLIWLFNGWDYLQQESLKRQWKGYTLLASENSIYGNIAVTKSQSQRSFFYNGAYLYTVPDQLTAEEAVHFALLEQPKPEEVLLVGGGVGGLLEEALKHPVKKVDYVELDPLIIRMAQSYLSKEEYSFLRDRRVKVKNLDGRLFIKSTNNKYDCVIVHLGDPHTVQMNRYYTVEFFREVKRALNEGGILSFALTSSESYINRQLKYFLNSIYFSLKEVFLDVKVIPGGTAYFLACDKPGVLTYDYKTLEERAKARSLDIKYVREYYLFSKLSPQKLNLMESALQPEKGVKLNYDFRPVSIYYSMVFWMTHFKDSFFRKILQAATETKIWIIVFSLCSFILLLGLIKASKKMEWRRQAISLSIMTTGFTQMVMQIVILLSFQIIYGYVYYKLGLIITAFMAGLGLGSLWIIRIMPKLKKDLNLLIWVQLAICIYLLSLPIILRWLSNSSGRGVFWLGANVLFLFLPIIAGFIGGFQFPLANKIYPLNEKKEIGRVAGLSYGLDLLGACLGAFLTAIFLIPILGIPKACLVTAIINFTILILLSFLKLLKN